MSQKILNVYEVKARFSHYARLVLKGRSFIIANRNQPFAELRPLEIPTGPLKFGVLSGQFKVPENFNAPLKDFEASYYGR